MLRILVFMAVLGMVACGVGSAEEVDRMAAARACDPVPGASPGGSVSELRSPDLSTAGRTLGAALEEANGAARGMRRWALEEGAAGATYATSSHRFGGGGCVTELERMVTETFAPSDGAVSEARLLTEIDATKIDASFDAWVRDRPAEDRAVAGLAERIEAFAGARPDLQVYVVKGGSAVARHAGVAIVDPRTREAIWIFGRAVRISAHRRSVSPEPGED